MKQGYRKRYVNWKIAMIPFILCYVHSRLAHLISPLPPLSYALFHYKISKPKAEEDACLARCHPARSRRTTSEKYISTSGSRLQGVLRHLTFQSLSKSLQVRNSFQVTVSRWSHKSEHRFSFLIKSFIGAGIWA